MPTVEPTLAAELTFIPDPGIRVSQAVLPKATVADAGTVHLFYQDQIQRKELVAVASDGLSFSAGKVPDGTIRHPYALRLPDGTWRQYTWDLNASVMQSLSSSDGVSFTSDPQVRYRPHQSDNGTVGVYDTFVDRSGGVVLLYVGDMRGLNNVRRAYSAPGDNGETFIFERGNVLGDDDAGGGGRTFVDIKSVALPDGTRRLFAMRGGTEIFSFLSDADHASFTLEPGVRLSVGDFTEFAVVSLHDPMIVTLPDGRYRMYLAVRLEGSDEGTFSVVSATTAAPLPAG